MAAQSEIIAFLDNLLETSAFVDGSVNGLQVNAQNSSVQRLALAVDAGESVLKSAVERKADLLLVHHGILWGQTERLDGPLSRKLALLFSKKCSLYAAHLPLDAHPEVGNNAQIARFLNLSDREGFCELDGRHIGISGKLPKPLKREEFVELAAQLPGTLPPHVLPFGSMNIERVGVVSGSGAMAIPPAKEAGLDVLVSGEPKHEVYHAAKELEMNAVFLGHYATETFGVQALGRLLEEKFSLESFFIDEPTGI